MPLETLEEGKLPVLKVRQIANHLAEAAPAILEAEQLKGERVGGQLIRTFDLGLALEQSRPAQLLQRESGSGSDLLRQLPGFLDG